MLHQKKNIVTVWWNFKGVIHPYSPDIAPTDYYLFRNYELFIRNKFYRNQEEIIKDFETFIKSKDKEFFKKGIYDLPNRWKKVIDVDGDYFD